MYVELNEPTAHDHYLLTQLIR